MRLFKTCLCTRKEKLYYRSNVDLDNISIRSILKTYFPAPQKAYTLLDTHVHKHAHTCVRAHTHPFPDSKPTIFSSIGYSGLTSPIHPPTNAKTKDDGIMYQVNIHIYTTAKGKEDTNVTVLISTIEDKIIMGQIQDFYNHQLDFTMNIRQPGTLIYQLKQN